MWKPKVGFMAVTGPTHIEAETETKVKWVNDSLIERAISALEEANCDIVRYYKLIASIEEDKGK